MSRKPLELILHCPDCHEKRTNNSGKKRSEMV